MCSISCYWGAESMGTESTTVGTRSRTTAGVGAPIMGALLEEDSAVGCSVEDAAGDPEDDGPGSSTCNGLAGKGVRR
ncbi:hypothetical protein GUJ93_ZPchr0006g45262 [Zizania palustris]|uniref:Uncharacterized protein n=1 Tax=Zizania palustris TaxID=103762 RepID=A0A8J5W3G1_ZIZPA|nr:hypothetical protein GUJ93_ZPchr0006g45262 [Zizania palustris]